MKHITAKQMELTMNKDRSGIRNVRFERQARAKWWFTKMRQVVNLAIPARAHGPARPEQTYLNLRQPGLF